MVDTIRGWWPKKECSICGKKGVSFIHQGGPYGIFPQKVWKNFCYDCWCKLLARSPFYPPEFKVH
jgi:hypothetical protein